MCFIYQAYGVCGHRIPPLRHSCKEVANGQACELVELVIFRERDRVCSVCWCFELSLWYFGFVAMRLISYEVANSVAGLSVASLFAPGAVDTGVCGLLTLLLCCMCYDFLLK
jgi:hypothetical protein